MPTSGGTDVDSYRRQHEHGGRFQHGPLAGGGQALPPAPSGATARWVTWTPGRQSRPSASSFRASHEPGPGAREKNGVRARSSRRRPTARRSLAPARSLSQVGRYEHFSAPIFALAENLSQCFKFRPPRRTSSNVRWAGRGSCSSSSRRRCGVQGVTVRPNWSVDAARRTRGPTGQPARFALRTP